MSIPSREAGDNLEGAILLVASSMNQVTVCSGIGEEAQSRNFEWEDLCSLSRSLTLSSTSSGWPTVVIHLSGCDYLSIPVVMRSLEMSVSWLIDRQVLKRSPLAHARFTQDQLSASHFRSASCDNVA